MTQRQTMTASELITVLQSMIAEHGDRPVQFSDSFFRYGINCRAECAANYDSPNTFLIKAFNFETGRDGPSEPLKFGL